MTVYGNGNGKEAGDLDAVADLRDTLHGWGVAERSGTLNLEV